MGIEGRSNNDEIQSQEIQQANIEQQAQNQEAHQRSGEQLEAKSTIDNEGERKQIEGKGEAAEDINSESSKLDAIDRIDDEEPEQEPQDNSISESKQASLDSQSTIESDGSNYAEEESTEYIDDLLENNSEIVDSVDEPYEDEGTNDESGEFDSLGPINDGNDEDDYEEDVDEGSSLDLKNTIEDAPDDVEAEEVEENEIANDSEIAGSEDKNEGEDQNPHKERINGKTYFYDDNGNVFRVDKELLPGTEYELNGYKYETDDQGRITSAEGMLYLTDRDKRLPIRDSIDSIGKGDQKEGDDRGHIIGDRFNGSNGLENMIPQNADINQKDYKYFENELADAVGDGKEVYVSIEPVYDGDSKRPIALAVTYSIDGEEDVRIFPNDKES